MPRYLSHRVAMSCGVSESWVSGSGRMMKSFWVPWPLVKAMVVGWELGVWGVVIDMTLSDF